MSKERLAELENGSTFDNDDVNWLLDQAKLKQLLSEQVEGLEWENKRYREALEKIKSVKDDEDFNQYAYMSLEMIDVARKALEGDSNE